MSQRAQRVLELRHIGENHHGVQRQRVTELYRLHLVLCKLGQNRLESVLVADKYGLLRRFNGGHLHKAGHNLVGSKAYELVLYVAQTVGVKLARCKGSLAHFLVCVGGDHTVLGGKNLSGSHGSDFAGAVSDECLRRGKNILRRLHKAKLVQHLKLKADLRIGDLGGFSIGG